MSEASAAGGGSIAWIDAGGLLRVGPQSAGARPGPACYGQGGDEPTVTDAAVVLGYIDPDYFLGGRMSLDVAAAARVIEKVAEPLKLSADEAASAVLTLAGEQMIKAIQEITVQDGVNPGESIIVAGGGAAGLNIIPIAQALGCRRVLLPRTAGALSACGGQFSNIVTEFSASRYAHSNTFDFGGVSATLSGIAERMDAFEEKLRGRSIERFGREYFVEARYINQQWEMEIPMPMDRFEGQADVERLVETFHDVHFRRYAVKEEGGAIECINWKGRITAFLDKPSFPTEAAGDTALPKPRRTTRAYFGEAGGLDTPFHLGDDLHPGMVVAGPAIIEGADDHDRRLSRVVGDRDRRAQLPAGDRRRRRLREEEMAQARAEAERENRINPGPAAGDGEPHGRGLPRDDQHHAAGGAVLGHRHGARFLVRGHHVRQPGARRGRGLPHPRLGHQHPDQVDAGPASRLCRGRCLPPQRPLSRQHAPGRSHHPRAGVPRGGALLHRRREGSSGRCRQQPAHHLHGAGRGRPIRKAR